MGGVGQIRAVASFAGGVLIAVLRAVLGAGAATAVKLKLHVAIPERLHFPGKLVDVAAHQVCGVCAFGADGDDQCLLRNVELYAQSAQLLRVKLQLNRSRGDLPCRARHLLADLGRDLRLRQGCPRLVRLAERVRPIHARPIEPVQRGLRIGGTLQAFLISDGLCRQPGLGRRWVRLRRTFGRRRGFGRGKRRELPLLPAVGAECALCLRRRGLDF